MRKPLHRTHIWVLSLAFACHSLFGSCAGQFPSLNSNGTTIVRSPIDENITIRYKTPASGTCTTVFPIQRQYSGYIDLPPDILNPSHGNFSISTFFWFIEARQQPEIAPLTVFINGGPGSSSMVGLFQEVGPCEVVELDRGVLGTIARTWGWDRSSNMLFVDQPVQVGFSYDELTNASLNLLDETIIAPPTALPITQPNYTFLNGTFASGNPASTSNTSQLAAISTWHFLQTFLTTFPQYNPGLRSNDTDYHGSFGLNLFTESYGGKYGPALFNYFEEQNQRRNNDPAFQSLTVEVKLASLGILNGWIDLLVQMPYYPRFAYNNTYGIQAISQVQYLNALSSFNTADGCQQKVAACRGQELTQDPNDYGNIPSVNDLCSEAQSFCQANVVTPFTTSGRSVYDISQNYLNPFPSSFYLEYLNQATVQQSLGTPVNYTQTSLSVYQAFNETGDYARDGIVQDIVDLLSAGVRVALVYGDRDYICNWLGGEAISFAIAAAAGVTYVPWYSAGYVPIVTNDSYIGGVVKEYGNLSFSRIYDAGHLVPAYQPETAFTVFSRIIQGTGISLGLPIDLSSYETAGDSNSTHTNSAPSEAKPTCYLRAMNSTCDMDQKNMIANRAGVIINGVLYDQEFEWIQPAGSISEAASTPTELPSSSGPTVTSTTKLPTISTVTDHSSSGSRHTTTSIPTGVFTATGIPKTTSTSSSFAAPSRWARNDILNYKDTLPVALAALGFVNYGLLGM